MIPPNVIHHLQDVQPPLVTVRQRLQDFVEPGETTWKFGSSPEALLFQEANLTFRGR